MKKIILFGLICCGFVSSLCAHGTHIHDCPGHWSVDHNTFAVTYKTVYNKNGQKIIKTSNGCFYTQEGAQLLSVDFHINKEGVFVDRSTGNLILTKEMVSVNQLDLKAIHIKGNGEIMAYLKDGSSKVVGRFSLGKLAGEKSLCAEVDLVSEEYYVDPVVLSVKTSCCSHE